MKTIDQMFADADPIVENYRTDLDIDRQEIAANPAVPFIHCTRENGTFIFLLYPAGHESWPPKGETRPYLFGHATREFILNGTLTAVHAVVNQHSDDGSLWHYYDGAEATEIDYQSARDIVTRYVAEVQDTWSVARYV